MKHVKMNKINIPFIFTWFILLMLLTTPVFSLNGGSGYDEGIFEYVLYSEIARYQAQMEESFSSKVIRSRPVRVDFKRIFEGIEKDDVLNQTSWSDKLIPFNLFFDVDFLVRIEKVVGNRDGSLTLIGKDTGSEVSQVIFTVKNGIMVASLSRYNKNYIIRYVGAEIHDIQEMDHSKYEGCVEPVVDHPIEIPDMEIRDELSASQVNTTIDVMVVYTAAAKSGAGGTTAIQNLINQAVAESNTGYSNTSVSITLRLVHTAEVSYSEAGFDTDTAVRRLQDPNDGYMDNVHSLRDQYGADVVVLIYNDSSSGCGQAYGIYPGANGAFCVVGRTCATGSYTFAHEIGHLQGARHDRYVDNTDYSPYTYNHGRTYHEGGGVAGPWRTIMAYNAKCISEDVDCVRINYWSNPDQTYFGVPLGIAGGYGVGADNHKCLNNTRTAVANYRSPTQTVTFQALADTFVRQDNPNTNYGGSTLLRARGPASGAGIHSFIKFTVSGVGSVKSAKLRIRTQSSFAVCHLYHMVYDGWQEYTLTWNTRNMSNYGYNDLGALSANVWYEFDVTNFVTGNDTYTFWLAASDVAGQAFYSRQSSYKPTLIVTY
jgi:hypothetical protein